MWRTVRWWALAGFIVPFAVYLDAEIRGGGTPLSVLVWPGGFLTMAIRRFDLFAVVVISIAITSNVVLYSAIGLIWWLLFRRTR